MMAASFASALALTASFDPADNKLRLRSPSRLDSETYAQVKAAGFRWAPKQELFVAPMWTPERADLLIELCGEIGDEDTSLVDRAEERADRFVEYGEHRAEDAMSAKANVDRIAAGKELGQPIICGHHSEKRARKDAEKIESGMRKAVKMWETSKYWEARAKGALRAAKYKELPGVRHRRIKGLEADVRRYAKAVEQAEHFTVRWSKPDLTHEQAMGIANYDGTVRTWSDLDAGTITAAEAATKCIEGHARAIANAQRWMAHLNLRLAYEKAMLGEGGGLVSDRFDIQPGGRVLCRNEWFVVRKVNRVDGRIVSVSIVHPFLKVRGIETVSDYRPPTEADAKALAKVTKLAPIVNYPGEGFREMTKAEWDRYVKAQAGCMRKSAATAEHGAYRYRLTYSAGVPRQVFITDAKVVERPAAVAVDGVPVIERRVEVSETPIRKPVELSETDKAFTNLKSALRNGVRVVSAPQLFPTPDAIAGRMVKLAEVEMYHEVLEPSAGTGSIVRALMRDGADDIVAVEVNQELAEHLRITLSRVHCVDFLSCNGELGTFDRIVMNPPFANGADIEHIKHAIGMLKPGGKLVALCPNGAKQSRVLRPLSATWEELPEGSFREQGTGVRVVLLSITAP